MLLLMVWAWLLFQMTASRILLDIGKLMRVLEDWCQPFPGFFSITLTGVISLPP